MPPSHVLLGLGCALSIERRLWPPRIVVWLGHALRVYATTTGVPVPGALLIRMPLTSLPPPTTGAFFSICGVHLWCDSGLLHSPLHMWCAATARPARSAARQLASHCLAQSPTNDGMLRCAAHRATKRALLEEPPAQKASDLSRCCDGRCACCARCPRRMHAISLRELRIQMSKYSCKYSCP